MLKSNKYYLPTHHKTLYGSQTPRRCYTTNFPKFPHDAPPKGRLTEMTGFATFVHWFEVPLQLTCVPGVICACRNEYVVPCCVPLLSTVQTSLAL